LTAVKRPRIRRLVVPRRIALRQALADERVVMIAVFAVLRTIEIVHSPIRFPDTNTYLPLNFLGYDGRLWTVPLIWKVFATSDLRELIQLLVGVVGPRVKAICGCGSGSLSLSPCSLSPGV
jgi:hypothetical protein